MGSKFFKKKKSKDNNLNKINKKPETNQEQDKNDVIEFNNPNQYEFNNDPFDNEEYEDPIMKYAIPIKPSKGNDEVTMTLLGETQCGKETMMETLKNNKKFTSAGCFLALSYIKFKMSYENQENIKFNICKTKDLPKVYGIRNYAVSHSNFIIIIYDSNNNDTYLNIIEKYINLIKQCKKDNYHKIIICANKTDEAKNVDEQLEKIKEQFKVDKYYKVSSLNANDVVNMVDDIFNSFYPDVKDHINGINEDEMYQKFF